MLFMYNDFVWPHFIPFECHVIKIGDLIFDDFKVIASFSQYKRTLLYAAEFTDLSRTMQTKDRR